MTNKGAFRGTGSVLRFTLAETLKSRANIISCVILLLLAFAAYPMIVLIGGADAGALHVPETTGTAIVTLANQTTLPLDASRIDVSDIPGLTGEIVCNVSQKEDGAYVITPLPPITCDEETLSLVMQKTALEVQRAELLQSGVSEQTADEIIRAAGVQIEQDGLDSYVRRENGELGMDEKFALQYGYAIIAMFLCLYSTIYIIRAIAEEKASRLMETLLVSVRPMALILGKILAVIIYIVGLFAALIVCFLLSAFVTPMFMDAPALSDVLSLLAPQLSAVHLGLDTLLIAIISLLLGYAFVAVLGGLAGACCSESEDIQSANSAVTFVVMAGYLVSCFTGAIGSGVVTVILALCPVVSIFTAPVLFVSGAIPFYVLLISWVIQAGLVVWLFRFTGRLYADMLIYRGTRLKLRDLLRMSKQIKRSQVLGKGGEAQ